MTIKHKENLKKLPLLGIVIAVLFIYLGVQLTAKEDEFTVIVGYINIIFFSGLLLLVLNKLLFKNNK